jgi:hypothetical protein
MKKTSSNGLTFLLAIFLAGLLLTSWKVGVFEGMATNSREKRVKINLPESSNILYPPPPPRPSTNI